MLIIEKNTIAPKHECYEKLMEYCHFSKNLYNAAVYDRKQEYIKSGKNLTYEEQDKRLNRGSNPDYSALPPKVSQKVLKQVNDNYTSFYRLLKLKTNGQYNRPVNPPKYLKKNGYNKLTFTKDCLSKNYQTIAPGLYKYTLCKTSLNIQFYSKVKYGDIKEVSIVPKTGRLILTVLWEDGVNPPLKPDNGRRASIDLGVNNLMALVTNTDSAPLLFNGRPIKSINQYYNKMKARLQSELPEGVYWSKKLDELTMKRDNKLDWELHNMSRLLVDYLVSEDICELVIGHNKEWKRGISIGRVNNQKFVGIPFSRLISMIEYKCARVGVKVTVTEESYTSRASFLDRDRLPVYRPGLAYLGKFSGKRVRRGLYRTGSGLFLNADVNGAGNIMRKVVPDSIVYGNGIVGIVGCPRVVNVARH